MILSLADLLTAQTKASAIQVIASLLQLAGFPTTAWGPFNVGRAFAELVGGLLSDSTDTTAMIAKLGFAQQSSGKWLTVCAHEMFAVDRRPATFTTGKLTITDTAGVGPVTLTNDAVWALADATDAAGNPLRFVLKGDPLTGLPVTVPLNGSVQARFLAEMAGVAYNVPNGTISRFGTPIPGLAITNAGGTVSWITSAGDDDESDDSVKARCAGQLPLLGMGPEAQYDAWARAASSAVNRTRTVEGTPNSWDVQIYLAGVTGPVANSVVTAVQNYVDPSLAALASDITLVRRRPLCTTLTPQSATAHAVTLGGAATMPAKYLAQAKANAIANLVAIQASLDIGGKITRADLFDAIVAGARAAGARYGEVTLNLTSPAADVVPATSEVGVISVDDGVTSLLWQAA